jgi:hypothetical protein
MCVFGSGAAYSNQMLPKLLIQERKPTFDYVCCVCVVCVVCVVSLPFLLLALLLLEGIIHYVRT